MKKTLTTPLQNTTCTDHLGNKFDSGKEMCDHWNISYPTYTHRIQLNWSQEKALTTPPTPTSTQITDPFGNRFSSINKLCKKYFVNSNLYLQSIKKYHYSQIEALKLIPNIKTTKHWTFDTKLQVVKHIEKQYFLCIFDNHEIIMHYDKIIEYCTEQLQLQYQQGGQKWLHQHLAQTI